MYAALTVVIPVYNKRETLLRAVESVLRQRPPVEALIVVDDGSTDDSLTSIAAVADPRLHCIRQANGGVASARNCGIEAAQTEWVAFLDADDEYLPGFAAVVQALITAHPQAVVCATAYERRWPDGRCATPPLPDPVMARQDPFGAWARGSFFSIGSSACVRRQTLLSGGIRFPLGESLGEDQEVIFRLFEVGAVAFAPEVQVVYHCGQPGSLSQQTLRAPLPCYVRLAARARQPTYPRQHLRSVHRLVNLHVLNVARVQAQSGQRFAALQRCCSVSPRHVLKVWAATLLRCVFVRARS